MKKQHINSFYDELRESFVRIGAKPIPLIALGLWFLGFYLLSIDVTINLKIVLPIFLVLIIVTITLSTLAKRLYLMATHESPRVLQYYQPSKLYSRAIGLIFQPCNLYAVDTLVSIYYKEEAYEPLIGIGHVENVSDKGLIQVVAWPTEIAYKDVWERVCQNDTLYLRKISVKPSVPKGFLRGVTNESNNEQYRDGSN